MDNIDGKQARRTGTSSPLGELFDHGIDSLNCTLGSLLETAAMGYGPTQTGAFTALVPCLPMFFSTWETYHTHTLYLGYFNGPTEGLILACSIMILSGIFGPQIWSTPLGHFVPALADNVPAGMTMQDIWIPILIFSFTVAHLPFCVMNVVEARREQKLPIAPVFLEWFPMIVYTGALCAWLGSPHTNLLKDNQLVLLCLTLSLVFGRMTTKIILAHLTRQPFPYWTSLLWPLIGGAIIAHLPTFGFKPISPELEHRYLQATFVLSAIVYGRWAYIVINKICDYLGINCLTIPSRPLAGKDKQEGEKVAPEKLDLEKTATSNGRAKGEKRA